MHLTPSKHIEIISFQNHLNRTLCVVVFFLVLVLFVIPYIWKIGQIWNELGTNQFYQTPIDGSVCWKHIHTAIQVSSHQYSTIASEWFSILLSVSNFIIALYLRSNYLDQLIHIQAPCVFLFFLFWKRIKTISWHVKMTIERIMKNNRNYKSVLCVCVCISLSLAN